MLTWDRYRAEAGSWHRDTDKAGQPDPLARFTVIVDRLLYVASAAFLVCVVTLLVG